MYIERIGQKTCVEREEIPAKDEAEAGKKAADLLKKKNADGARGLPPRQYECFELLKVLFSRQGKIDPKRLIKRR